MKAKGDAMYLEKQPPWLKDIVPSTTVARDYGIHRSSEKIRDHLHSLWKKYLEETLYIEKDENGSVIKELLGASRVFDTMLLEETIKYNDLGNFDRVIAIELALALAAHLNPMYKASSETNSMTKAIYDKHKKRVPSRKLFAGSRGAFSKSKTKLFSK
jgi:hypothetical protein